MLQSRINQETGGVTLYGHVQTSLHGNRRNSICKMIIFSHVLPIVCHKAQADNILSVFCQNVHLVIRKPGNQRQDLGRIGLLSLVSCMFSFWFLGFSELVSCDKQMTWQTLHSHDFGPLFSWVLSWFEELCRLPQPIFHLAVHSALVAGIKRHIPVSLEGQKSTEN